MYSTHMATSFFFFKTAVLVSLSDVCLTHASFFYMYSTYGCNLELPLESSIVWSTAPPPYFFFFFFFFFLTNKTKQTNKHCEIFIPVEAFRYIMFARKLFFLRFNCLECYIAICLLAHKYFESPDRISPASTCCCLSWKGLVHEYFKYPSKIWPVAIQWLSCEISPQAYGYYKIKTLILCSSGSWCHPSKTDP